MKYLNPSDYIEDQRHIHNTNVDHKTIDTDVLTSIRIIKQ